MAGPTDALDVRTAISTLDKALAYTRPLRRRMEGLTWVLFALASALFAFSYFWVHEQGLDPHFRLMLTWLVGYALLAIGPALLSWRIIGIVNEGYTIDAKRVAATILVLGVLLIGLNYALWHVVGETQLTVALNIALFGSAAWAALGGAQWSRLSDTGRRDTWFIGVSIFALGFALVYATGATDETVALDVVIYVLATATGPLAAGLWRLARG